MVLESATYKLLDLGCPASSGQWIKKKAGNSVADVAAQNPTLGLVPAALLRTLVRLDWQVELHNLGPTGAPSLRIKNQLPRQRCHCYFATRPAAIFPLLIPAGLYHPPL